MKRLRYFLYLSLSLSIFTAPALDAKKKKNNNKKPDQPQKNVKLPTKQIPKTLELNKLLSLDKPAWELTPEQFEKEYGSFFKWMESDKKEGARYHAVNNPKKVFLSGLRVWEAVARFENGKLNRLTISLYNRGDAQTSVKVTEQGTTKTTLDVNQFKALIQKADQKINDWLKAPGKRLPPRKLVGSTKDLIYEKYWVKAEQCAGLQWGITQTGSSTFRPEYLKFIYTKYDPHNDPRKIMTRNRNIGRLTKAKNIKNNVKTKDGFKYIDNVPMVDQGPKGYCAVAATERILKYYGSNVDQHTIAQLVDTSTGTDPVKMIAMLKKAGPKLGIKIYTYLDPPDLVKGYNSRETRDYIREIEGFNRLLKKEDQGSIPMVYPIVSQIKGAKLDLFKEYKCIQHKTDFKKFKSIIKKNIDLGIPVVWGLSLGIVPENGKTPQAMGGHMRLIIGYNKDLSELVFTDTWGAGHEFKTIKTDDAWIVTSFYGIFKPK